MLKRKPHCAGDAADARLAAAKSLFRLEVGVSRRQNEIGNWLGAQFCFKPLGFGRTKIERVKKPVKPDNVREIVVKVGEARVHAILPQLLSNSDVPTEVLFRFQAEVVSENFVLTARRTESLPNTGVQNSVRFVDFVTAGKAISPHSAELVEVIKPAAGDED